MVMESKRHQQNPPASDWHHVDLALLQATNCPPVPILLPTGHLEHTHSQAHHWCSDGGGGTAHVCRHVSTTDCMTYPFTCMSIEMSHQMINLSPLYIYIVCLENGSTKRVILVFN